MARKKKEKLATQEQLKKIEDMLGQPINDFMQVFIDERKRKHFAETLAKKIRRTQDLTSLSSGKGMYQPIHSEQLFQSININPQVATSTQIEQWLTAPHMYDTNLRHLSQYLSYAVGQYHRNIWYLNTIKSYNYMLLPSDSSVEEKIDKKDYLHAYDICLRTLQKMNIKYQIPKVDLQTMLEGISFWWISETKDNITLLPLPADYCYITAPWTYGFMFALDLTFFDKFISIPNVIPELYEAYNKFTEMREALFEGKKLSDGDLAPYQYYQVPVDKGWCFTFNPVAADKVPPLSSAMGASLDLLSYKELLKNKIALDLFKVIALKIPLDKDNKQMVISYKLAEEITQIIQSLLPDNIKVYSSPFDSEPINTDQTNRFDEIVSISNDSYYATSGTSQNLFGSINPKQGTALTLSATIDYMYSSTHMYTQYANFVNWQLALKTRKYKFQVTFFGNKLKETEELDQAMNTVRTCNTGLLKMFGCMGLEPFQVKSTLILEDTLGIRDLMKPLVSAFNSKQDDGGRPKQVTKSDAGEITDDYESNDE